MRMDGSHQGAWTLRQQMWASAIYVALPVSGQPRGVLGDEVWGARQEGAAHGGGGEGGVHTAALRGGAGGVCAVAVHGVREAEYVAGAVTVAFAVTGAVAAATAVAVDAATAASAAAATAAVVVVAAAAAAAAAASTTTATTAAAAAAAAATATCAAAAKEDSPSSPPVTSTSTTATVPLMHLYHANNVVRPGPRLTGPHIRPLFSST